MKWLQTLFLASVFLTGVLLLSPMGAVANDAQNDNTQQEKLWHHRNLGKAFYENPATQYDAVGEFLKALELAPDSARERVNYGLALMRGGKVDEGVAELEKAQKQDPTIPHTWFNLGIAYKQASDYEKALAQLQGFNEIVSNDAVAHYNLGILYKLTGNAEKSVYHLEKSAELDKNLAGPHFQLATAYRQAKRTDDAKREMALFREIKKRDAGAAVPEDLEWSYYSEIYETIDPRNAQGSPSGDLSFDAMELGAGFDDASANLTVLDANGDGKADLLATSKSTVQLFLGGKKKASASGLESLQGVTSATGGDIDNDGLVDLAIIANGKASIYRNTGGGKFVAHPAQLPAGDFTFALWLDFDHDYDIDLFLLGKDAALARNNGEAGFSDQTADFPFVEGHALGAARLDLVADTQGMDLAVVYADRKGVLYRDMLAAVYERRLLPDVAPGMSTIVAHDADNDGWTDLTAADSNSAVLLINDHKEGFRKVDVPADAHAPLTYADFENRAVSELVAGGAVFHNRGLGQLAPASSPKGWPEGAGSGAAASADFTGDGQIDLAAVDGAGKLHLLTNTSAEGHWLRVGLEGVKNLKLAPGAEIEVKAGARYQKQIYHGTPLVFGLGPYQKADAVRITWPNGLIQNETLQESGTAAKYKEAQRLSGSCPMIYTWNGEEFEFITDVLGVAPLGASAGNGEYFPVDHDEVIQIAGESLVEKDGHYEVRIIEELREVAYLDEVRLITVDHPASIDIFTNDKFKGPPFPEFRLFGVEERRHPVTALDHHRRDVLERLLEKDQTYPDGFARNYMGVAEMHHLEMDFGAAAPDNQAVLVLSGWVDWADGSTFLNASQSSAAGLVMPYLQVKNAAGEWQTVIDDMGIPAGKPKTIVVDLSDQFLTDNREVRIVTNLCVYWDEIFLSESTAAPQVVLNDLHAVDADLRFGGFSKVVVHPQRKQPEYFVYAEKRSTSMWNPTPGLYTRFGDVAPLLNTIDDRLVIMGAGDEVVLRFSTVDLPEVPAGWRRDFLLFVDGWAKDGDANTAHSQTVGPLPYHGMPQYPYGDPHHFPDDEIRTLYREFYNTRPALRLIRPLNEGLGRR